MYVAITLVGGSPARVAVRESLLDAVKAAVDMVPTGAVMTRDETRDDVERRVAQALLDRDSQSFEHDDSAYVVAFVADPGRYIIDLAKKGD